MTKTCRNCLNSEEHKRTRWYAVSWCKALHTNVRMAKNRCRCMHWKESHKMTKYELSLSADCSPYMGRGQTVENYSRMLWMKKQKMLLTRCSLSVTMMY